MGGQMDGWQYMGEVVIFTRLASEIVQVYLGK